MLSTTPQFRLVPAIRNRPAPIAVDADQQRVLDHPGGLLRVLAGPGTGKTTTLVEAVAERVQRRGVPVSDLLLLTFSRAAAAELRARVTARLDRTVSEPVARTFHSYAFGLVRRAAVERGDPPPRLLSGSEQEATLRELFAGRLAGRRDKWPSDLVAATGTRAFTDELRELLMRAIERDLGPRELRAAGRRFGRPDWVIAADILAEYLEVTSLKAPGAFDAAELIQRAKWELEANPGLLALERATRRRIFVDEYQDCDPAQLELLALLADGADEVVVIGDPDQAIYAFRGAEQNAMFDVGGALLGGGEVATVSLTVSRRSGGALLAASRRIAARLGGPAAAHRELVAAAGLPRGSVTTAVFSSATAEAAHLATVLRRAHLEDGVAWSQMAVLVRSAGPAADSLRRGLAGAGVPVGQPVRGALADEPAVGQLLLLLRSVSPPGELTASEADSLLLGPVGRADPLQLMRMRRQLRRLAEPVPSDVDTDTATDASRPVDRGLATLLVEPGAVSLIAPALRPPVERLRAVISAGQQAHQPGASAEDVLWSLWEATRLSDRLERRSHAGGADGARADRDLDAVLALFAEAATVAERAPGGGPEELYQWVVDLQITDAGRAPNRVSGDSVSILTAHASKGLEWQVVCVAGVQDGVWPNLRQRGSLLGAELLVDVAERRAAISSGLPGQRLAEERRLFYVACTRARGDLHVTALATADAQPSRFLDELDPLDDDSPGAERRVIGGGRRSFALRSVVAELRAAVLAPGIADSDRAAAVQELARLAAAGVEGAHPDDWWGLAALSTEAGIRPVEAGPVPIRPSKFEAYQDCELRALLSELGAVDAADEVAASLGTLVHAVAELAPAGASEAELTRLLEDGWSRLEFAAPWHEVSERARAQRMLAELADWLKSSRTELTELGRELPFEVSAGDAVLSGKVDRLERDQSGRLVVVDLKTTKTKPSQREVAEHPQLAAYQFAVTEGGFGAELPPVSGGARLLQLGSPTRGEQAQPAITEFEDPAWVGRELARIAAVLRGNSVTAHPGANCKRCPVRISCPAQQDGRQVTS